MLKSSIYSFRFYNKENKPINQQTSEYMFIISNF